MKPETTERRNGGMGLLAWFAKNSVAANVFMAIILAGGVFVGMRVRQEVFPEVNLDTVVVTLPYLGASPEEVEQGVVLATEEAVRDLDGVDTVTSIAREGVGVVWVELENDADPNRVLSDVESAVARVTAYPANAERPTVSLATSRYRQVSLVVYGDQDEATLKALAEQMRDELLDDDRITRVELAGVRSPEISIEVPPENLRTYGLTLDDIAARIRAASVEIPGGVVKTSGGEILLRTSERREHGTEFENIVILSRPDGSQVRLTDIADVRDTFEDTEREALFNGKPAVMLEVYRTGDARPTDVSAAVEEYMARKSDQLPAGVKLASWLDFSEIFQDRRNLMVKNAFYGLLLVLLILGLFLEIRLAFWVTLGIPVSFVGALLFMPAAGVSINMISMFAFIVVLGMVVDDAIIIGESIHRRRQQGMGHVAAAVGGLREVAFPVIFAVATTMIAFAPMLFLPGFWGEFFRIIPIVVISVLAVSLFESLFVLPAHLAHSKPPSERGLFGRVTRAQRRFSRGLEWVAAHLYLPVLVRATRRRYLTLAVALGVLVATVGLIAGGRVEFTFFAKIEGDVAMAGLELPNGSPAEETRAARDRIVAAAYETLDELGDAGLHARGVFAELGAVSGNGFLLAPSGGSHLAQVSVYLVPIDNRPFTTAAFTHRWREKIGRLAGVESLRFSYDTSGTTQSPIQIDLSHPDQQVLRRAAADLAERLSDYDGVFDIDDGFAIGKEQLDLTLKPAAKRMGLTERDLAQQVRGAFFGAEALRLQRGRDELRVYVRYPEAHRRSEHDIEDLIVHTPTGGDVPLAMVARVQRGRSVPEIERRNGRRTISVTADVDEGVANANKIVGSVFAEHLPELQTRYPGLTYRLGGDQDRQAAVLGALGSGYVLALFAILALLAIAFRSYLQPIIIMAAIPFGLVGATIGHLVLGYSWSIMSLLGLVALSGVVVNDSLILVLAINEYRRKGATAREAVLAGGARRFRPILLTSLTTFFGLAPLLLETSVQARFLIPMAVSLAFGIIFATALLLVLIPTLYLIVEDAKCGASRAWSFFVGKERPIVPSSAPSPTPPSASSPEQLGVTGQLVRDLLLARAGKEHRA